MWTMIPFTRLSYEFLRNEDGFLGQIFSALIGGLFGGGGSSSAAPQTPPMSNTSLSPSGVPQTAQPNPVADGNWLKSAGKIIGSNVLDAFSTKMTAGMYGDATLKYNQSAFPGTNPWEHLSGGARGQELAQLAATEKQSRRAQDTALGQTRMQMGGMLASEIIRNNGNAGVPIAAQLLRNVGVLDPGMDFKELSMARGATEAGITNMGAQAGLAGAQAAIQRYDAETRRISAGGRITRELKSAADLVKEWAVNLFGDEAKSWSAEQARDKMDGYLGNTKLPGKAHNPNALRIEVNPSR